MWIKSTCIHRENARKWRGSHNKFEYKTKQKYQDLNIQFTCMFTLLSSSADLRLFLCLKQLSICLYVASMLVVATCCKGVHYMYVAKIYNAISIKYFTYESCYKHTCFFAKCFTLLCFYQMVVLKMIKKSRMAKACTTTQHAKTNNKKRTRKPH